VVTIIAEFGEKLELIAPEEEVRERHPKRGRRRRRAT
jgi:hypothetical protein